MEIAIMVALALHSTLLMISTDGFLAMLFFKAPALYSLILLAIMVADHV